MRFRKKWGINMCLAVINIKGSKQYKHFNKMVFELVGVSERYAGAIRLRVVSNDSFVANGISYRKNDKDLIGGVYTFDWLNVEVIPC